MSVHLKSFGYNRYQTSSFLSYPYAFFIPAFAGIFMVTPHDAGLRPASYEKCIL